MEAINKKVHKYFTQKGRGGGHRKSQIIKVLKLGTIGGPELNILFYFLILYRQKHVQTKSRLFNISNFLLHCLGYLKVCKS